MDARVLLIVLSTLALFSERAYGARSELGTCLKRNVHHGCRIFAKYKPTLTTNCSSWMAQRVDLSTISPPASRSCSFVTGNDTLSDGHGPKVERDLKTICRRVSRFGGKFFRDLKQYCCEIAYCGKFQVLPHTRQRQLHQPTNVDQVRGEIDLRRMYQHVRCILLRHRLHAGAQW